MKNNKTKSLKEITNSELQKLEASDKVAKLERDIQKDKKVIAEYKEREKQSARALVLLERKLRFVSQTVENELNELSSDLDEEISFKLNKITAKVHSLAVMSDSDREFIANKKHAKPEKGSDIDSRFNKLKAEFEQKIGATVLRKPGRPRKEDQSILADMGLRHKVEKEVETREDNNAKISELFFAKPSSKATVSVIPTTDDSLFDFNEALNPNLSLKDIMADLMNDKTKK